MPEGAPMTREILTERLHSRDRLCLDLRLAPRGEASPSSRGRSRTPTTGMPLAVVAMLPTEYNHHLSLRRVTFADALQRSRHVSGRVLSRGLTRWTPA